MKDYYKILHLTNAASASEIKRSYRRLAMVYHPDRTSEIESHESFLEINEAYEILSNSQLKTQYDNLLNSKGDLFVESQNFNDYYEKNKNTGRAQRVYRATRKTKDIITPYIVKTYKIAAYFSVVFMSLLLLDFVLPDIKSNEIVKTKQFGDKGIMEYMLKTDDRTIIVEQDEYTKFKEGDAFIFEKSSLFGFDKYISKETKNVMVTYDLPGNFSKFFSFFIIITLVLAIFTIKSKNETDILQYGTANFYLELIVIVSVFAIY